MSGFERRDRLGGREDDNDAYLFQFVDGSRAIAIAGDRISVAPTNGSRVNEWNLAGDFLGRRDLGVGAWITALEGTDTGDLIASYEAAIAIDDWRHTVHIARLSSRDSDALAYLDHIDPSVAEVVGDFNSDVPPQVLLGVHRPSFAVTRSGDVYLSGGDEYQILALRTSGAARWAVTEGHGHLYVFPEIPEFPGTYTERPLDVYSSAGRRLFSGYIPVSRSIISRLAYAVTTMAPILPREPAWTAALGDHVYTIEQDAESGEDVVVRYELVEPF